MAICENCGTSFTPSDAHTEVTSLRILCEKCEAERKAERARRAAEKAAQSTAAKVSPPASAPKSAPPASAPKSAPSVSAPKSAPPASAPPVPATRRASPAPASTGSANTGSASSTPTNSRPASATPPVSQRTASSDAAPRTTRPAAAASKPATPAPIVAASAAPASPPTPRPAPAAGGKGKPRGSTPDVRREIELLKKRENKVMMYGWIVCGALTLIALGVWWRVQAKKSAEAAAVAAAKQEVDDFVAKMKGFDITNLVQATEAITYAESKKPLWEDSSATADVGTIVSRAKTNLETAKDRKETEERLANAEQVINNAASETPQIIAKTRRILSDLEQRVDSMPPDFKTRLNAAKSVIDKTYVVRLHDDAKAIAAKGPSEGRAALTAYTAAEDEVLKLFEESMRRKNKEAEEYYKQRYRDIITESDALATAVFTPDVIEKAPWKDLLAGDAVKGWANDGLKGFRIDSGELQAVGPEIGAGKTAILSIGDREQWRDFEIDVEFTVVAGTGDFYFRLGRRPDNAGDRYPISTGEGGFKLGQKYSGKALFIGSNLSITWNTAEIEPYTPAGTSWARTRKGAFGVTLNEGSELKISRLRIRELR
jgi:hypothetical protein